MLHEVAPVLFIQPPAAYAQFENNKDQQHLSFEPLLDKPFLFSVIMAENIYSKGTRVWFEDKDHAWISAEVLSVTKGNDDTIKLVFVDERGKVHGFPLVPALPLTWFASCQEITLNTTSKEIKEGKEGLPPLRNPPLLETADDLATLSHLNEPSGSSLSMC